MSERTEKLAPFTGIVPLLIRSEKAKIGCVTDLGNVCALSSGCWVIFGSFDEVSLGGYFPVCWRASRKRLY